MPTFPQIGSPGGSLTTDSDIAETDGTNPVTVSVLGNDNPTTGFALIPSSVQLVSGPATGRVTVDTATGALTYAATGFFGSTDSFRYTVRDTSGAVSSPTDVTIVIHRPAANDDFGTTTANTPVSVDVLANDTDPDGNNEINPATVSAFSNPAHGTLSINPANGKTTYTPASGFVGTDSWQYTITDFPGAQSAPGRVTVVVAPSPAIPASPTAFDDIADTDGNNAVTVDVLTNDRDAAGHTLQQGTVTVVGGPTRGSAIANPLTGQITYTANGFFMGTDTFQYTVGDGTATSAPATVTIIVNRPTANDDFADTDGNNPATVDVLANDTDPDGNNELDATTVHVVSGPTHGTVAVDAATGKITYTATGSADGTDSFQYTVTDLAGAESAPGRVTIVIHRPTANPDTALTFTGTPVRIPVLANDTDPDGNNEIDPSSVNIVSGPSHGTLAIAAGVVTYTPTGTFTGIDSFQYTITDFPGAVSAPTTVRIKVEATAANQITAAGAGAGGGPAITIYNSDGTVRANFFAFDQAFGGGVRVAVADVTGDGVPDVIAVPGPGGGPIVRVFSGVDLSLVTSFFAYDPAFRGGLTVAAGDVTGDGIPDIITGAGEGGGPQVNVFSAAGHAISRFFAFDPAFRGGVNVAVGDVNGDGWADIATGAGVGGGPQVTVFSGANLTVLSSFFAFAPSFRGGVSVALADSTGDTLPELIAAAGPGGGPQVLIVDALTGTTDKSFFAYAPGFTGGIHLGSSDVNQDGRADLVIAPGSGRALPVLTLDAETLDPIHSTEAFAGFLGGVYVGGAG